MILHETGPALLRVAVGRLGRPLPPGAKAQAPSLRDKFEQLKARDSTAYYSSEVGMKELGWNGENFFESFPGCDHAAGHS